MKDNIVKFSLTMAIILSVFLIGVLLLSEVFNYDISFL